MDKRIVIILIFILVLVGIIVIGKQQEQDLNLQQVEMKAAKELKVLATEAQKAQQQALQDAQRAEAEAQKVKQLALEAAKQAEAEALKAKQMAEEAARKVMEEVKAKVGELVVQAQALLDGGQYQAAIDLAQKILADDPNNADAKSIIERATAMLKEAVQEKAEILMQEGQGAVGGVLSGFTAPEGE